MVGFLKVVESQGNASDRIFFENNGFQLQAAVKRFVK